MNRLFNIVVLLLFVFYMPENAWCDTYKFVGSDGDWNKASNWINYYNSNGEGKVPRNNDDVIISKNVTNAPGFSCQNLTLEGGVSLYCSGGISCKQLIISDDAMLSCDGDLNTNSSQFVLNGNADIAGNVSCGQLPMGTGSSLKCGGDLDTHNNQFSVNGAVDIAGKISCGQLPMADGSSLKCGGDLNTHNNQFSVRGDVEIGGSISCGQLPMADGSSLKCGGDLDTHNNQFSVNGDVDITGKISCGQLPMADGSSLKCGGDLNTHNNQFSVRGDVEIGGSISCGQLPMADGSSLKCDGSLDTHGNQFVPKGDVEVGGNMSCGQIPLGDDTTLRCDGEFRATSVSVTSDLNGTEVIIDFLPDAINHSIDETKKLVDLLIEKGAYTAVKKYSWTGSVDSDWFNIGNWSKSGGGDVSVPDYYTDVTIDNTASCMPVISGDAQIAKARNVFISNGVSSDVCLTIDCGIASVKFVYVKDATRANAVVVKHRYDAMSSFRIETGGDVLIGDASTKTTAIYSKTRVELTLQTGVTYYVGSATSEGDYSGFNHLNMTSTSDYDDLYMYNAGDESYTRVDKFTNNFRGGSIYLYWVGGSAERIISQTGAIRNSEAPFTVLLDLYRDGEYGWNLISNPYQYSFPLTNDGGQFYRDGVEFVAFRRFNRLTKKYESVTYSFGTDVSLPKSSSMDASENYIAPQQAFFVKANVDDLYFGFNPMGVAKGDGAIKGSKLKAIKAIDDVLYLSLNGNVSSKGEDQTALVFRDGGTFDVNRIDADKKMESSYNNQLYLLKGRGEYAIGLYPELGEIGDAVMPLGFIAAAGATEASIKAIDLAEFNAAYDVYLCDNWTGDIYDLRENDTYSFSVDESGVRVDDRFAIALKANKSAESDVPTSLEDVEKSVVAISGSTGAVVVDLVGLDGEADVCIYDVAGRVVSRAKASNGINRISVASKGVCVVEVVGGRAVKNAKVIVR